jgi:F0F1-type ATP synthase membrane subunit b/b'
MNHRTKRAFTLSAVVALLSFCAPLLAAESGESGASSLTLGFYIINFVAFVLLMAKYAGPGIRNYFSTRAQTISSAFDNLENALREAQAQAEQAAARVNQLAAEKARIEALTRNQIKHEVEAIRQNAQSLVAQMQRDAHAAARSLSETAERRFKAVVAQHAAQAARELLRAHLEPADQHRLVEDFFRQMPGLEGR